MITIFNKKEDCFIEIDESSTGVRFNSYDYNEGHPYIMIELIFFNFFDHVRRCPTCKKFSDSFGSNSNEWFISYYNKTKRLDLTNFGHNPLGNLSSYRTVYPENYHILKLKLSTIPESKAEIESLIEVYSSLENFERCDLLKKALEDL